MPSDFARALRAAITARGIGLERVQDALRRRGTPVSLATLSYWQSGRSEPTRASSMAALAHLEEILRVPADSLLGLLGRTGRRASVENLWPGFANVDRELAALRARSGQFTPLVTVDRLRIGADATEHRHRTQLVLRAEVDGLDRMVFIRGTDPAEDGGLMPTLSQLSGCTLGAVRSNPDGGVFVAELLFGHTLRRGDVLPIEFLITYDQSGEPEIVVGRRFIRPVHTSLIEVEFAPGAEPAVCERYAKTDGVERACALTLDPHGRVHALALDFGPGELGVRWSW